MNYATIKTYDIANGPGVRVSLFVSGCAHHCPGCFNEIAWRFDYGTPFTEKTEQELLKALAPEYISGFSLLGGEPFEPQNQAGILPFLHQVKKVYPEKTIWCYTGFTLDCELWGESRARGPLTAEMLSCIDVLVDGRFEEAQKNISLPFRGSENQRIIDVPASAAAGTIKLWKDGHYK